MRCRPVPRLHPSRIRARCQALPALGSGNRGCGKAASLMGLKAPYEPPFAVRALTFAASHDMQESSIAMAPTAALDRGDGLREVMLGSFIHRRSLRKSD